MSIAKALQKAQPSEDIIYVADSLHAPYGEKSEDFVSQRCHRIVEFLASKQVKLVVVACNTATLNCISELRANFSMPFVGAEPGIKPALAASLTGTIGVMATQSTLESAKYQRLLARYAGKHKVINQACNGLVEQIESNDFDSDKTIGLLRKYLEPMLLNNADQIVLGCTHYGFLTPQINVLLQDRAQLVNTSAAIARQTTNLLEAHNLLTPNTVRGKVSVYSSGYDQRFEHSVQALWDTPLASIDLFAG
ncbi:glutamate racemase [Aliiglaciecola litoralis]|uniref:Glutamate racemase n=1 Tax=Aliiglaciecola litoralis TaxID=582857 RepID=A0ABP3WUV1_9ALTE